MDHPFRWDLARREHLGRLVGDDPPLDPSLVETIRRLAGRVLAEAGDSTLVFLGRSPESLFDYLSGSLQETPWEQRLVLLNLSLRGLHGGAELNKYGPAGRAILAGVGLAPRALSQAPRPVALVDLIATGQTFERLMAFLDQWAAATQLAPEAYRRRLRVVGITIKSHNSPKTWRWRQQEPWARSFRPSALRGISLPYPEWSYFGDSQAKVTPSLPTWRWADPGARRPPRDPEHLDGLRQAVAIRRRAEDRAERRAFARYLTTLAAMRHPWFRRLVTAIRP